MRSRARRQSLGQYPADGVSRRVDAEQRSQSRRQVHRLGVGAVGSGLEGEAVKRQRHMSVVGVRGGVIGPTHKADGEWRRNAEHVPSAKRRIAVQILQPKFGVGGIAPLQLRAGVIGAQARLFQRLAHVALRVFFLHL